MKKLQILGTGCPKCEKLATNTAAAAAELGLACEIEKVTEIEKIMAAGVMMTPALVVDGIVKVTGRVPDVAALKVILQGTAAGQTGQ
ncbi:TM0996/MTH895 family glutaredoxin-like protein [bacterium]|nr:TM0996/MTH895 family glutaredoxin-like protein [bacterium]